MQADLEDLQVKEEELENLVDLNVLNALAVDLYQALICKNPQKAASVLLSNLILFGLLLIFAMPLSLLAIRRLGVLPEDVAGINRTLAMLLGICLFSMVIFNLYLWQQAKKLKVLAELLNDVEQYNKIIYAINLVDQLEFARSSTREINLLNNREEVIEILRVIKESLINALRVEAIVRKHQKFIDKRYEALANLENNLTDLMSFDISNQASEYSRLLNDALQVGMSVHKEVRALQHQPSILGFKHHL